MGIIVYELGAGKWLRTGGLRRKLDMKSGDDLVQLARREPRERPIAGEYPIRSDSSARGE